MALIISNESVLTATQAVTGTSQVIVSGDFGQKTVSLEISADLGDYAPLHTFFCPGAKFFDTKTGTTLRATIVGSGSSTIDVSII